MNITSPKFLAITFTFIVYATILLLIMAALPLHAQTNAPAENGTNRPVAVTDSAPASNTVAVTGTEAQKPSSEPSPVRIDSTGIHVGGKTPADNNKVSLGGVALGALALLVPLAPFIMVGTIVALALYFRHHRDRMMHETLRTLVEKGVPVTPEMIASLKTRGIKDGGTRSRGTHLLLVGLILAGTGIGIIAIAGKPGLIPLFIGVAFLVVWLVEKKKSNGEQPPKL